MSAEHHAYLGFRPKRIVGIAGGQRVLLFSGVGGSGDNFTNLTLDDEAFLSIEETFPPFTGSFRPQGLLSLFDGGVANGDWTLELADSAVGDMGRLSIGAWILASRILRLRIQVANMFS